MLQVLVSFLLFTWDIILGEDIVEVLLVPPAFAAFHRVVLR